MKIERIDLFTGAKCNNNCIFCVLNDRFKDSPGKNTEKVIEDMKKNIINCNFLTLTGGEPTIRKDIFELIRKAKEIGYKTIHLQTNARMLSYDLICRKLIKLGVNSFTVSLHAHNEELGDLLSRTKGSFRQTINGIKNIKKFGGNLITNTIIIKENYKNLLDIIKLAVDLGADQIQMVFVRPKGQAFKNFKTTIPKLKDVIPYVNASIDYCKKLDKIVLVEGIPVCLMEDYKENVAEKKMPKAKIIFEDAVNNRNTSKLKFKKCAGCKLNKECTGLWTNYAKIYGFGELNPIKY
jgi:cyclic pyranopterin phosphate synthase